MAWLVDSGGRYLLTRSGLRLRIQAQLGRVVRPSLRPAGPALAIADAAPLRAVAETGPRRAIAETGPVRAIADRRPARTIRRG